jgi:hypothetical protein
MSRIRKRGQDGQNMTRGQGNWHRTAEMRQLWQTSHESKVVA